MVLLGPSIVDHDEGVGNHDEDGGSRRGDVEDVGGRFRSQVQYLEFEACFCAYDRCKDGNVYVRAFGTT